ncbi:unnamed protein product [Zymoseptoria tritici ST99CH_3D7]|nr:unnamed protein product [Zymoseptoria tritici ST99CH_3D7]
MRFLILVAMTMSAAYAASGTVCTFVGGCSKQGVPCSKVCCDINGCGRPFEAGECYGNKRKGFHCQDR